MRWAFSLWCAPVTEAGTAGRRGPGLPGGVSVGCAAARAGRTKPAAQFLVRWPRGGAERLPNVGAADCASPGVACNRRYGLRPLRMAAVSEAADRFNCKCGDGFCPDSAEGIPALGEADHKLLHAWAWGTEPHRFHLGSFSVLPAEHIGRATSLRKTQNRPSAQAKDIATTLACTSASSDSQKRLSNSHTLSEHQSALRSP